MFLRRGRKPRLFLSTTKRIRSLGLSFCTRDIRLPGDEGISERTARLQSVRSDKKSILAKT